MAAPFHQQIREAAGRTQCRRNAMRLGMPQETTRQGSGQGYLPAQSCSCHRKAQGVSPTLEIRTGYVLLTEKDRARCTVVPIRPIQAPHSGRASHSVRGKHVRVMKILSNVIASHSVRGKHGAHGTRESAVNPPKGGSIRRWTELVAQGFWRRRLICSPKHSC